ncbi:major facilitator superfamily domain-containing protein [Suillus discolor]|uniref:Major facilitator superfamily domain-containing protein n=1 Tax=Suillus discolor TaxID=1912936 RepID=A0A9P7EVM6_9AGAM|nr:major facilitator superfamily domain-containing protein [Suillus discolor]KAG2093751.1 major facilitator superfamily domain-containing protein [Suillus discolor]
METNPRLVAMSVSFSYLDYLSLESTVRPHRAEAVTLTALLAIIISMFSFGLSKSFLGLLVSRVVCGAFDLGDAVIKTLVMDITDTTNMPKAYSYMPIPLMVGTTVGPLIGGSLSRPADRFPGIFGQSELLKTYPYLLPCSISASFIFITWLVAYICLKEIDPGEVNPAEVQPKPLSLRALLTSKMLSATASYATMGLFQMGFNSVLPVFYATPIELGGLSLDPPRIGALLAASGVTHGMFQLFFYAHLHDRFSARAIHITGVSSGIPMVILFPVTKALARVYGIGMAVWLCVAIQLMLKINLIMCFPCMTLFIRAAAPNRASIRATNGIAQVAVAVARIVGPVSAALVFSYLLQQGHDPWLIYYFLIVIAFLAVGTGLLLPRDPSVWEDPQ